MKNAALSQSAAVLAAAFLSACGADAVYQSVNAPTAQISVSESAEVSIAPDVASVSAGVVTQGKDAGAAMKANAALMSAVFAELKKAGIAQNNIRTSQLTLQPRYDYSGNAAPTITGYEAQNMVTVKSDDLDKVGPMLDALVAAGVNNINQVEFGVKDPKAARDAARTSAIKAAREKAQSMAEAAGVKLGHLQSLSESGGFTPQPIYSQRMEMAMDAATPTAPGEQSISVTVNMVYHIDS